MDDWFGPVLVVATLFVALPWLIFHYVTKWKTAPKITEQDEALLDEMHQLSRRLEERLQTVERIMAADNPDWRTSASLPGERQAYRLENSDELRRERDLFRRETRDPGRQELLEHRGQGGHQDSSLGDSVRSRGDRPSQ